MEISGNQALALYPPTQVCLGTANPGCTGEPFWEMARREMPQKLLRAYTGTQFVFST
jgi:hypothetical protein